MTDLAGRLRVVAFVIGCTQATVAVAEDAAPPWMQPVDRAYRASRVYAAALTYFAHWADAPDMATIDAAYRSYLEAVLTKDDRPAFTRASMRFLATFRNSHTLFFDTVLAKAGSRLPFYGRPLGGRWVVTASSTAELHPGDVLATIDGRPFEDFVRELRPFISASTEQWVARAMFVRLPGMAPYTHLLPQRFLLGLGDGRQVAVDRGSLPDLPIGATEGRWLDPGKVAYLRVPSFFGPDFEKRAIELVHGYKDAPALVVDLRGNGGGSTPSDLVAALMNRPRRWWTESTPASLAYFRLRAGEGQWQYQPFARPELVWRSSLDQPAADAYQGRLALLVDGGCLSSCEDLVMPFKDNDRAIVVGETTGGSSGQPYLLDLGEGMLALIGAKRETFPDGTRFEGVGIRPDLVVTPTVEDLRAGRDVVLEAARQRLR
ncbi:MAG TPA: S41 family peptidase [Vicinamibacteria bacterium]|nr:S41 family peptidase [Vicinamibacteria bacterium]